MNKPLLILFLLLSYFSLGQNLIYNGDFEIYDVCPDNTSGPGNLQVERCIGWTTPTLLGTSDYFNVCNNSTTFHPAGVPSNGVGFQYPYNGDGYCGFFAWDVDFGVDYREYIQTKLSSPLIPGKEYKLSFYVSNSGAAYSLIKIGALFGEDSIFSNSYAPIIANPQVVNQNDYLIDSLNWIKIEGTFVADGNEEFVTFGYFEDSLSVSDTINTHDGEFISKSAYYFIDGVELIEVINTSEPKTILIPNLITPNGDGVNDNFNLFFSFTEVLILNRWGNLIWSGSKGEFWNGKTQDGNDVSEGSYFYIIKTDKEEYKGFVQVIR